MCTETWAHIWITYDEICEISINSHQDHRFKVSTKNDWTGCTHRTGTLDLGVDLASQAPAASVDMADTAGPDAPWGAVDIALETWLEQMNHDESCEDKRQMLLRSFSFKHVLRMVSINSWSQVELVRSWLDLVSGAVRDILHDTPGPTFNAPWQDPCGCPRSVDKRRKLSNDFWSLRG